MADNPPFGAIFTYYLKEPLKTSKKLRREEETEVREKDGDVPFPGWDTLAKEDREEEPSIILTVKDGDGNVVRRISGPPGKGIHRVAWDLRYPPTNPTDVDPAPLTSLWRSRPVGPMVTPGQYSVDLSGLVDGRLERFEDAQSFEVLLLEDSTLPLQDRGRVLAFEKETAELGRKAMGAKDATLEALERLEYMKKAILDTPGASPELLQQARDVEQGLKDVQKRLTGDPTRRRLREPRAPSILGRISKITSGSWKTTYGPTQTHRQNYEIAAQEFQEASAELRRLTETDLKRLEEAMEQAGAPWTPGRAVP
jgi:hypothetical protein